jgi:hypothetical protein
MIAEYKLYHGAVLADIVDRAPFPVAFSEVQEEGRLLNYVLNGRVALQIKFATQKLHPWHFSFLPGHLDALRDLSALYDSTFVALVCRTDGIIMLNAQDMLNLQGTQLQSQGWLRVDRRKRQMYRLYGPTGEFPRRLASTTEPIVAALSLDEAESLNNLVPHACAESAAS